MASLLAPRPNQATGDSLPATGCPRALAPANESLARVRHLTSFQSSSPVANVNESIASANDSLPLTIHLTRFQGSQGVTKVPPLSTPSESITTPHKPLGGCHSA
jgi:hypothetical protein